MLPLRPAQGRLQGEMKGPETVPQGILRKKMSVTVNTWVIIKVIL